MLKVIRQLVIVSILFGPATLARTKFASALISTISSQRLFKIIHSFAPHGTERRQQEQKGAR